jgi:glycosyltransferase involved in cell wall biosynthesis
VKPFSYIVVVSTAWGSRFGGINSFSTDLCRASARVLTDCKVVSLCFTATEADRIEAKAAHVELFQLGISGSTRKTDDLPGQIFGLLKNENIEEIRWWIGHDAITGKLALDCSKGWSNSRCAVFMHMSYDDYGYMKHSPTEAGTVAVMAEVQREVLQAADVGFAVGPLLFRRLKELREESQLSTMLIPGLSEQPAKFPTKDRVHAITFGRFESSELFTKQAPLVVAAYARAVRAGFESRNAILENADLRVIGAPSYVISELRSLAEREANRVINLKALEFIEDKPRLLTLLHDCNICLMLSWHEGFGLSAWEAIGSAIPVVVSRNSGVFQLLDSIGGSASGCVLDIDVHGRGDGQPNEEDIVAAKNAILSVAADLPKALANARALRQSLRFKYKFTWDRTAQELAQALNLSAPTTMLDGSPTIDINILPEPLDVIEGLEIASAHKIIRLAEIRHSAGHYTEALEALDSLKNDTRLYRISSIAMDATLIEAEVCLRLSKFERAHQLMSKVATEAEERSDWPRYIRAKSVESLILRDRSMYGEAIKLSDHLLKLVLSKQLFAEYERVYRLAARSFALDGQLQNAVEYATKAFELSKERSNGDAEAKSALALGEAYRHGLNQETAIQWYTKARDSAGRAGNADCFLWAVLGLADSLFLTCQYQTSADMINRIQEYVSNPSNIHPLETLHIKLSLLSATCQRGYDINDELNDLLESYNALGITWPNKYAESLLAKDFTKPKKF